LTRHAVHIDICPLHPKALAGRILLRRVTVTEGCNSGYARMVGRSAESGITMLRMWPLRLLEQQLIPFLDSPLRCFRFFPRSRGSHVEALMSSLGVFVLHGSKAR
jgi:hypothetical protein